MEHFVISVYRDCLETLKNKLTELVDKGENVAQIL